MNTSDNNESTQTNSTDNNTRSRRSVLAVCTTIASLLIAGCSSNNTGGSDKSSDSSGGSAQNTMQTPKGTIRKFFQAKKNLNRKEMNDMIMNEGYYDNITKDDIETLRDQKMSLNKIVLVEKSNGTAIVQTSETYKLEGFESTRAWNKTLKKTESGWKIYNQEMVDEEDAVV